MTNENTPARDEDGWFVSSFTNGSGSCVEVKFAGQGTILVRGSKDRRVATPIISLPSGGWASLLKDVSRPV